MKMCCYWHLTEDFFKLAACFRRCARGCWHFSFLFRRLFFFFSGLRLDAVLLSGRKPFNSLQKTRQCVKKALYWSVNALFSTKVLIGDTIFTSPLGDGAAYNVVIRARRRSSCLQRKTSPFISIFFLRSWVLKSNQRPPLCSQALYLLR